ncbi:hypothetical protein C8R47DRAFT_813002 [Mycena vitilis]|nr:hypothetical protein C8R47DRAFT_813002 [Mycena vitilis]
MEGTAGSTHSALSGREDYAGEGVCRIVVVCTHTRPASRKAHSGFRSVWRQRSSSDLESTIVTKAWMDHRGQDGEVEAGDGEGGVALGNVETQRLRFALASLSGVGRRRVSNNAQTQNSRSNVHMSMSIPLAQWCADAHVSIVGICWNETRQTHFQGKDGRTRADIPPQSATNAPRPLRTHRLSECSRGVAAEETRVACVELYASNQGRRGASQAKGRFHADNPDDVEVRMRWPGARMEVPASSRASWIVGWSVAGLISEHRHVPRPKTVRPSARNRAAQQLSYMRPDSDARSAAKRGVSEMRTRMQILRVRVPRCPVARSSKSAQRTWMI